MVWTIGTKQIGNGVILLAKDGFKMINILTKIALPNICA